MISGIFRKGTNRSRHGGASSVIRLLVSGCILMALIAPWPAAAQQKKPAPSPAQGYFLAARKALAAADFSSAIQKLQQAIQADPKFPEAYLMLGFAEFQHGDTAAAIEHYQQGLKLRPSSYSGHYNLALAYLREHRLEEGRAQLALAVKLGPNQADAAYDLGMVLLELGHPAEALPHLMRARKINPGRPDAAFNIVRAELEAGKIAEARSEAQAAAKHLSSDFQWNAAVGQLFLKSAQPKDAAVYFQAANLVRPDDIDVRHQLALIYLESQQIDKVISTIGEPKTADDYFLRASAYYLDHHFTEADQDSARALTLAPDNPQILALRTRILQRAGEQTEALEVAKKAIALAPTWDQPYYLAGISLYYLRHYPEAEQNLAKAAELNPQSARALFLEAIAMVSQDKRDAAEQNFRRAITLQPGNARFRCHLGILLMRENKYAEAEESFRKSIELMPGYALSHHELGTFWSTPGNGSPPQPSSRRPSLWTPLLPPPTINCLASMRTLAKKEKSEAMLNEFNKRSQQEATNDAQTAERARDDDTRKETEF